MARKKTRYHRTRRSNRTNSGAASSRLRAAGVRLGLRIMLLAGIGLLIYSAWLDIVVRGQFEGRRWQLPARIYARPLELYPGAKLSPGELISELKALNYRSGLRRAASYRARGRRIDVQTRSFPFWDGVEPAHRLLVKFQGNRLLSLNQGGKPLALVRLEPQLIGRIYPNHSEDRILVRLAQVPPLLIKALLAVEDRQFYSHYGISPTGMARALWANLRAGQTRQGGSTLTQQLAKSYFLSNERSVVRKINDVLIALILEARYSKAELLQAYLNEIYLGQQGRRAIHGFGLAARFYFGRRLNELNLSEIALLVGLVKGPSFYNPRRHPQRALQRRNLVLRLMREQGVIKTAVADRARRAPLGILARAPLSDSPHPAFLDLVKRQLQREYRQQDLQSEGLRIFTSLDPQLQRTAESVLRSRLAQLESAKRIPRGQLQAALVMTDTHSGEVLALAGGREPRENGFNRAVNARRPIGSLIKPLVYLSALESPGRYNLLTPIDDAPVQLQTSGGAIWRPRNYDGKSHGTVPLITALAHSYNQATVRLGMRVGIGTIIANLKAAGLGRPIPAYPSLLLGALDLSPLEVSALYQTLAAGGFRQPLKAIRNVTDRLGAPLERYPLELDTALDPKATFLIQRALQEVMRTGTGRYASRRLPVAANLAGKTGTTDDLRDSWFAGFGADHLLVVWLGRDDNRSAGLSGASGALRVWTDIMARAHPRALELTPPAGVVWASAAPLGGAGVSEDCAPGRSQQLPFIAGTAPAASGCTASLSLFTGGQPRLAGAARTFNREIRLENSQ